ncbi:TonB-dependent receptor, partial [Croceicoccus sp. F390]
AINITTSAPSFNPEFKGEISVGNYESVQVRASGSAALSDRVAMRLSLTDTTRNKGFIRNVQGGRLADLHSFGVRGQLLFEVADRLSLRLIGDYSDLQQDCCIGSVTTLRTTRVDGSPLPNNFLVRAARFDYVPLPVDPFARLVDLNRPTNLNLQTGGGTAILDVDLGSAAITSVTAWRSLQYSPNIDGDTTSLDIFTNAGVKEEQEQFSQELRIASTGENIIDYVAGVYYFDQRIDDEFFTYYGPDAALWILGPAANSAGPSVAGQAALNGLQVDGTARADTKSYAGFGQVVGHITSRFNLTGGIRYTWEKKSGFFAQEQSGPTLTSEQILLGAQAIRNAFGAVIPRSNAETKESKFSGLITASYAVTNDILGFFTYSRGFKSGGLNLNATAAPRVIAPEKVDSFEVGLKSSVFNKRLTLNLSAFSTRISNYQSQQIDTAVAQTAYIANVGTVRSRGLEADLSLRPMRGLNLFASGSYIDATYRDFTNAPCPVEYLGLQTVCDLSGRNLPGISKYSASIGGTYSAEVSGRTDAYLNADYSYRSKYNATYNLAADSNISGYGVANARIGLRQSSGSWDLSIFARNLFNEDYIININPGAFNTGQSSGGLGDPRTYGVSMRTRL